MGEGRSGKLYAHVEPSKKSLQTIRDRITELTRRERTVMPIEKVVEEVNAKLRGWTNYFYYRNCSQVFVKLRRHVEQRFTIHLRKRHKVKSWDAGYVKFPRKSIYRKYGLYEVPTTAG